MLDATTEVTHKEAIDAADVYRKTTKRIDEINSLIRDKQAAVANKYEAELTDLTAIQNENIAKLEGFINANRDQYLGAARSTDFAGLKIGFRKTTAKLKLLGKATWKIVLQKLQADPMLQDDYLVQKPEIDKTKLKKANKTLLKKLGLSVDQQDNFFVKL